MRGGRLLRGVLAAFAVFVLAACANAPEIYAPEVARIEAKTVKERIGKAGFHLVDGRYYVDWEKSHEMIVGAVREDPLEVSGWATKYSKTEEIVVYCA